VLRIRALTLFEDRYASAVPVAHDPTCAYAGSAINVPMISASRRSRIEFLIDGADWDRFIW
jgi:hypothetical protein